MEWNNSWKKWDLHRRSRLCYIPNVYSLFASRSFLAKIISSEQIQELTALLGISLVQISMVFHISENLQPFLMQDNSPLGWQYLTVAYPSKLSSSVKEEMCINHKQVIETICMLVLTYRKMFAFLSEDVLDA